MKKGIKKKWKIIALMLMIIFIGIQLIHPSLNNDKTIASGNMQLPPDVQQIFERACYDCHSNQTQLKWFDQVAPAYWLVRSHIINGRKVLNFSAWDSIAPAQRAGKLFESFNQMEHQTMPLGEYVMLHPSAKVSDKDLSIVKIYLASIVPKQSIDTSALKAGLLQFKNQLATAPSAVKAAPNGIQFIPDYKNWKAISTSDRFDNGTMRVILGNDIAVKAIEEENINPWPDGTVFAKVAWTQAKDSSGIVHTGEFKQVEFMIKDSKKYASTGNWGWARWWKGTQLVPYGTSALFTTECMNCHQPMKNNDLVFTFPLHLKTNR